MQRVYVTVAGRSNGLSACTDFQTHWPVIAAPSHSTGSRGLVAAAAGAAIAEGADGLMVEVHNCPEKALTDAMQQLSPREFSEMMASVGKIAAAVGRKI